MRSRSHPSGSPPQWSPCSVLGVCVGRSSVLAEGLIAQIHPAPDSRIFWTPAIASDPIRARGNSAIARAPQAGSIRIGIFCPSRLICRIVVLDGHNKQIKRAWGPKGWLAVLFLVIFSLQERVCQLQVAIHVALITL